ncbi:hypothetical protein H1R20_g10463, partial [Candolleomyces eurysporus]
MDPDPNPFYHLSTSNAVPDPLEAEAAQSELDKIQLLLRKLEKQQQLLRTVLSPLRRIPLEVLGEIFSFTLPVIQDEDFQRALINLCLVCRRWRDAAFAVPQFWTHLLLDLGRTSIRYDDAQLWLSLSGNLPASLTIKAAYHDDCSIGQEGCELANDALVKLLMEGPPLDHISLHCTSSNCFRKLVAMIKLQPLEKRRSWDLIRSLELVVHREWREYFQPGENIFVNVPPVTSFSLHLPSRDSAFPDFDEEDQAVESLRIPESLLTRLKTFELGCDWDGSLILSILNSCTNVEVLTLDSQMTCLDYLETELYRQANEVGIALPNVRTLRLRHLHPGSADFLPLIKTPSLVELDISFKTYEKDPTAFMYRYSSDNSFSGFFLDFLDKSRIPEGLRRLRIHSVIMSNEELQTSFACITSLTHLTLDDVDFKPNLLDALGKNPEDYIYLPNLDTLELLHLDADFPVKNVYDFVKARLVLPWTPDLAIPVCEIKKLRISQRKPDTAPTFERTYEAWLFDAVYHMDASMEFV